MMRSISTTLLIPIHGKHSRAKTARRILLRVCKSAKLPVPGWYNSHDRGNIPFRKNYKHQYDIKQDGINGMRQNDINADQTRYSIILLEGNEPSVEIVRAVYQISQQNLLKTKELIVNASQVIFEGNALEVRDMIQILDDGFVEYKIEPDYPYAESVLQEKLK